MAANAVDSIIDNELEYDEKVHIKYLGPPRPDLIIEQQDKRKETTYKRHFNKSMYSNASWLCGCNIRNAFFCFVCILINPDFSDMAWTKKGITDLKHLGEKVKKHKLSGRHLHNELEFAMLGRSNIQTQLDSAHRSVKEHNEKVKKNRYILNKVIDCIKFCGAFELALCGHDEKAVANPGIFKGLINLFAEVDTILKEHLNSNCGFIGLSKTIHDEILDAILHVCREIIKSEIEDSNFLALQADEITDFSNKQQIVLIYRYEFKEKIYERFWGIFSPESLTADELSQIILEQLQLVNIEQKPNKLISQSYDGAMELWSSTGGVQAQIKNFYTQAHFIHCYAHQFNSIMEKAVSQNRQVKVFFANIEGFSAFFLRSTKRTSILNCFIENGIPIDSPTGWNFHISTVTTVHAYIDRLVQCFDEIIDKDNDNTTIRKSIALKNTLNDSEFIFWLNIFNDIMPHVDLLHNQMQEKRLDPLKVKMYVCEFKENIQIVRNTIDTSSELTSAPCKLPKMEHDNAIVAKEVYDIVTACVEDLFEFSDHLALALLLCPEMFAEYRLGFPETTYQIAIRIYSFLDGPKLKQELLVLYKRNDFCTFTSVLPLLQMFSENNLLEAFSETVKIIKIICTIPMTTVESERNFSTVKRIKTFLRNTLAQDRLTALAMCSMEKDLIQKAEDFNVRVIDHFIQQKEWRADFMYKSYN